jgi:hypothetical protein
MAKKLNFLRKISVDTNPSEAHKGTPKSHMKAKPQIILSLLAISVLCFALNASAVPATPITNIVTNGGFETGDFTGWTVSGNTGEFTNGSLVNIGVDADSAHSGNFGAFFGPVGDLAYLSQNLSTVAGTSYDLSFFLRDEVGEGESTNMSPIRPGGGPVTQEFQVFWNGMLIFSIPPNADPSLYSQFNFSGLVATGASTELRFGFRNDPSFWDIDDIVAGANSVPEALSSIWIALPVVGMFAFLQLRRKTA